jgi:hypothetical protein
VVKNGRDSEPFEEALTRIAGYSSSTVPFVLSQRCVVEA